MKLWSHVLSVGGDILSASSGGSSPGAGRLGRHYASPFLPALGLLLTIMGIPGLFAGNPVQATNGSTNVVLITIDTLRADYVSAYGRHPGLTSSLDSLASDGVLFESAYCQVPLTPPSHASILTGTFPATHGLRDFTSGRMRPDVPTVATILKARGYQTAAFVSAFVLDRSWGMSEGFDVYFDEFDPADFEETNPGNVQRPAGETIDRVIEWLAGAPEPFLLWVHLFDPHHDYNPPEPFRTRYASDPYAGEVAYADQEIGRLLKRLKEKGQYDGSLVIATSDHGESLGEHGEQEHGFFLYESAVRVPLIFKLPGSFDVRSRRIPGTAQTVDILPTILQVLRLPSGIAERAEGQGLLSSMLGKRTSSGFAYGETLYPLKTFGWSPLRFFREGGYKFIEAPRPELYDLESDPGEEANLFATNRALAHQLQDKLRTLEARFQPAESTAGDSEDEERQERLRSLGYIAVAPARSGTGIAGMGDPKDMLPVYNQILEGLQAAEAGKLELSNAILEAVSRRHPELFIVHHQMGMNSLKAGKAEVAYSSFQKALELNPDFASTNVGAAQALVLLGRLDDAIALLEKFHRSGAGTISSRRQLAQLYTRKQRHGDAIALYEEVLRQRPEDSLSLKMLGVTQVESRDWSAGLAHLDEAVNAGLQDALIENFRGIALANLGRTPEAVAAYRKAIELNSSYAQPRINLALTLLREGRKDEALKAFEELCAVSRPACERYRDRFQ